MSDAVLPQRQPYPDDLPVRPQDHLIHRRVTIDPHDTEADDAASVSILKASWRRKWTVLACVVAAMASAMTYLHYAVPVYRSTAVIYVDDSMPTSLDGGQIKHQEKLEALQQVIGSSAILGRVADLPDLQDVWGETPISVADLKSMTSVNADDDGHVLKIHAESPEPATNAAVANALANTFIGYQTEKHRSSSVEQLKVLRQEKTRLEQHLKKNWADLLAFQQQHPSLRYGGGTNTESEARLSSLSDSLTAVRLTEAGARVAVNRMESEELQLPELRRIAQELGIPDSAWSLESSIEFRTLKSAITKAELEYADMLEGYGPDHRGTKMAQRRAEVASRALEEIQQESGELQLEQARNAIYQHRQMLESRLADLQDLYDREQAESVNTTHLALEYDRLESMIARTTGQLENTEGHIREIDLSDDFTALNVTLLDPASAGFNRVQPRSKIILAMGLMCGLLLGVGAAFLRELMDDRLRGDDHSGGAVFGLRVLGDIPVFGRDRSVPVAHRELGVLNAPNSGFAEAFRGLRTAIRFGSHHRNTSTLLVASAMPREGKSLVSANLAMAYAQSGLKTLLIDGDMRNARQEEMFRVDTQAPGLAEALRGDVSLEEAVTEVGCENLSLLAAGRVGRSPSDLLNTKAFTELLAEARQQYDQVIIDSPPVNAVNDARIISTLVDAVVVVLRRDESRSSAIKAALEGLDAVHAPVLGVVLNGQVQTVVPYPYSGALISKTNWETPQADWKVDRKTNGHANGAAVLEAMAADD